MSSAFASTSAAQRPAGNVLDQIGNTPLVRLSRAVAPFSGVAIYAKAEFMNPGGSVKDRPALNMILEGERSGALRPGRIILDATSGNTGIAYAMIGAAKGYRTRICMPKNASEERKRTLARLRRRTGAHGRRRRVGWSDPPLPRDLQRESVSLLLSGPVQQPCELESALSGHRRGDRRADRQAGSRISWPCSEPAEPSRE